MTRNSSGNRRRRATESLGYRWGSPLTGGIDEVGRGPLAGPVTAACVIFPPRFKDERITDSKQLTREVREELVPEIKRNALAFAVVSVGPRRIERYNIREASLRAMVFAAERARGQLKRRGRAPVVHFLVDGNATLATTMSHEPIIKGDGLITAIAAASILAKVARDQLMQRLDSIYPGYGFAAHKGYATKEHIDAIRLKGPCRIHRRTFAGVRELCSDVAQLDLFEHSLTD